MTMPKMHPRQIAMNTARRELPHLLWKVQDKLEASYPVMLFAISEYIGYRLCLYGGMAVPETSSTYFPPISAVVSSCEKQCSLTFAEVLVILTEHQTAIANHMLRLERGE